MDKNKIINNYTKTELTNFLKNDSTGEILKLFGAEGIKILNECPIKHERINYILTFSPYKNALLFNNDYLDLFLNCDISYFYANISCLNYTSSKLLIKRALELKKSPNFIAQLFNYINKEFQLEIINEFNFSTIVLSRLLFQKNVEIINKIIDNCNINLTDFDIDYDILFENLRYLSLKLLQENKENIKSLTPLITNSLAQKIFEQNDIYKARKIINDVSFCADATILNKYVKEKEDFIIKNASNDNLISPFKEIYETFLLLLDKRNNIDYSNDLDYDELSKLEKQYRELIKLSKDETLYTVIDQEYEENNIVAVKTYLYKLSNNFLSNYIIDYHFEENYYNITLDLKELLNLYYTGDINLSEEKLFLYQQIQNIDLITIEEKIELHEMLKKYNVIEMFYDDMAFARKTVRQAIKDYSLSQEELKKYIDVELSKQYGVDIYNISDEPFFGIVKTGGHPMDELPTGHSYSLVGKGGIAVYGNGERPTFLYDSKDLNPDQIVHIFPFDSFSLYKPRETVNKPSSRVNVLMMPEELVEYANCYNELLILEKGLTSTSMDKDIPNLKRIALYCVDKIQEKDVEIAKSNNVGIILINSKYCEKSNNFQSGLYKHDFDIWDYDYFDGNYKKESFESKRY